MRTHALRCLTVKSEDTAITFRSGLTLPSASEYLKPWQNARSGLRMPSQTPAGRGARDMVATSGIFRQAVEPIDKAQHIRHLDVGDGEGPGQPFASYHHRLLRAIDDLRLAEALSGPRPDQRSARWIAEACPCLPQGRQYRDIDVRQGVVPAGEGWFSASRPESFADHSGISRDDARPQRAPWRAGSPRAVS